MSVADAAPPLVVEIDGRARRIVATHARPLASIPIVTPVPLAPRALAGLAQLDGEVLPVLWPGDGVRVATFAILTETPLGRVLLLCGRVLGDDAVDGAEPLSIDALLDSIRASVRG